MRFLFTEYCRNTNSWAIWNIKHGTEWPGWVCLMCISFPAPISLCLYVCFLQSHGKLNAVSNLCHHKIVSALIFSLFQMFSTVWQLNQNLLMPNLWHHKLVSALIRVVLAVSQTGTTCCSCHVYLILFLDGLNSAFYPCLSSSECIIF